MRKVIDDPRRKFLVDALSLGVFASANVAGMLQSSHALGKVPPKLPPGRSIYKIKGTVTVNGKIADINTPVSAKSLIRTGPDSRVIFVVGGDAFILRSNSQLEMGGSGLLVQGMRILSGKFLSVFGKREATHTIKTSTATIGIRGTGIYIESEPGISYVCTCYGHTLVSANANPDVKEEIMTTYHDRPVYVLPTAGSDKLILPAPVINHTDIELALIEELVGRKTPFDGNESIGY